MNNKINKIIGVKKFPSVDTVAGLRSFASGRVLFGGETRPWAKDGMRNEAGKPKSELARNNRKISAKTSAKLARKSNSTEIYEQ